MGRFPLHHLVVGAAVLACLMWVADSRRTIRRAGYEETQQLSARKTPEEVKIVNFYTATGTISRGDTALICYSVLNAAAVRITPPVAELTPSMSRCVAVSPKQTTTYKLEADGPDGSTASSSFQLRVEAPPPPD